MIKNYLKYFYGIDVNSISKIKDDYYFNIDNYEYVLLKYSGDLFNLENTIEFEIELLNKGININPILKTKELNNYIIINENNYILLKKYKNLNQKITFDDLLNTVYIDIPKFNKSNWKALWEAKIDYFEYQLNQFGNKHPILRESFGYYSGFAELAISLLDTTTIEKVYYVLSHNRIFVNSTYNDLYNPFNLIIDSRVRDVAEYFKSQIFEKENVFNDIYNYLINNNLSDAEFKLFFIRMLYPSFYFDKFEIIMNENLSDDSIEIYITNRHKYEEIIKKTYQTMFNMHKLPTIEWLNIFYF